MSAQLTAAGARVRQDKLDEGRLQREIDRTLEEYRAINRGHYQSAEINDMRMHFRAIGQLPHFLNMLNEEIAIIKRHGPRRPPWWDALDAGE